MHQPDEKYQLNQHLAEWLGHCAMQGVRHDVKVVSGQ
jgi:uncharacterized protein YqiB (DUF1249 family)